MQLYRTQNEILDTQNRQYADKISSLEKYQSEQDIVIKALREQTSSFSEENSKFKLAEVKLRDRLAFLEASCEGKAADNSVMIEKMSQLREEHQEAKTQLALVREQVRLEQQALKEVQGAKQQDEQRWLGELDSSKRRLRDLQEGIKKRDGMLDKLRFENRTLASEVAELKKDSACMG